MRANFGLLSRTVVVGALSLSGLALVSFVPTSAVGAAGSNASQVSPSATPVRPLSGVKVLGWGFNGPIAVTSDGTHVWVANSSGNSVTELSASAGGLVRVIFGRRYGFDHPDAIAPGGTHVWVANEGDQSVTEFSAW
jgi:DNA-binding beta-propeller fold protein YncE